MPEGVQVVAVAHGDPFPGLHLRVRTSLSTRRGLSLDDTTATSLHLPAFLPLRLSFTTMPDVGPHVVAFPDGENLREERPLQFPASFTRLRGAAAQVSVAPLTQTPTLNVHDDAPLASTVPPFLAGSGTPEDPTRHSVVSSITARPTAAERSVAVRAEPRRSRLGKRRLP